MIKKFGKEPWRAAGELPGREPGRASAKGRPQRPLCLGVERAFRGGGRRDGGVFEGGKEADRLAQSVFLSNILYTVKIGSSAGLTHKDPGPACPAGMGAGRAREIHAKKECSKMGYKRFLRRGGYRMEVVLNGKAREFCRRICIP